MNEHQRQTTAYKILNQLAKQNKNKKTPHSIYTPSFSQKDLTWLESHIYLHQDKYKVRTLLKRTESEQLLWQQLVSWFKAVRNTNPSSKIPFSAFSLLTEAHTFQQNSNPLRRAQRHRILTHTSFLVNSLLIFSQH